MRKKEDKKEKKNGRNLMQNEWSEDEKCRLKEDFIIF
jgi:hypothetical protein